MIEKITGEIIRATKTATVAGLVEMGGDVHAEVFAVSVEFGSLGDAICIHAKDATIAFPAEAVKEFLEVRA